MKTTTRYAHYEAREIRERAIAVLGLTGDWALSLDGLVSATAAVCPDGDPEACRSAVEELLLDGVLHLYCDEVGLERP